MSDPIPSDPIEPADAETALTEIDHRREQVIRRRIFPRWYWWAYAALITMLSTAVQSRHSVVVWLGIAVFTVCSFAIDRPVSRAARAATPRNDLAGPGAVRRTLLGLVAFIVVLIGVMVTTALSLKAAKVPFAVTIAAAVTGVVLAVGAPVLVQRHADMLVRRSRRRG